MNGVKRENWKTKALCRVVWIISALALAVYPLRHVALGVDLWDGGYNYANFRYNSLAYMDSMWYFATWLANQTGSLLMKLPFGDTMLGMNCYTGLIVSALGVVSYLFSVKRLRVPAPLAFAGVFAAEALCWAPTAALYNYLTYLFLLGGVCLLYEGLTKDRMGYLAAAGVLLGLNVGNRFSNLAQTGLILAVWAYGVFDKKTAKKVLQQTGACVLGYLAAFLLFLLGISLKYGFGAYASGVLRLFQMTRDASDYTPLHMLGGIPRAFAQAEMTYWAKRFLLFLAAALAVCLPWPSRGAKWKKTACVLLGAGFFLWLKGKGFSYPDAAFYDAVYGPCVILLEILTVFCVCRVFLPGVSKEERLLSLLLLLVVYVTSLGGNNAIYASLNNGFFVFPAFFGLAWKFGRESRHILAFPVKCVLAVSALFALVSCARFGRAFVYEKAAGGRDLTAQVTGAPVLEGMKTGPENAENLSGLYGYLEREQLLDRECILFGGIPGVSYYMGLAPAMNIWSDLASYGTEVMERDLAAVEEKAKASGVCPLVILERGCADYAAGTGEASFTDAQAEPKFRMLLAYMDRQGYELAYLNEGFAVYVGAGRGLSEEAFLPGAQCRGH